MNNVKNPDGAPALPNPAQLRAMARPCVAPPAPCVPGRHCERYARGLGACVAGYCKPPADTREPMGGA